jgi:heme/copper-type cytochrome/quinol oxidase subunit 1
MGARAGIRVAAATADDGSEGHGVLYLLTAFAFLLAAGAMGLLMRAELAVPGLQFLSGEQYNQLFAMHGTIVLLLYATPILFGFANHIVPLQIGAPDVAFPRLIAFSYWLLSYSRARGPASRASALRERPPAR